LFIEREFYHRMDMDFQQYTWNPTVGPEQMAEQHSLIDDLFFGFEAPNLTELMSGVAAEQVEEERGGRTRRVTITEIAADEENEWLMVADENQSGSDESEPEVMNTDEIFQMLDESVQDWKMNLEVVVGDGLKRLRKATKESKLKTKYLPGETVGNKKLVAPKNQILNEWREEYESAIEGVQSKLDKLARDKMAEVAALYQDKLLLVPAKKTPAADPKKKITIDCRESKKVGSCNALKQMVRELDCMVAATQAANFDNCVPIYNLTSSNAETNSCHVVATPYEFPLQKYLKYLKETNIQQPIVANPKAKVDLKQFVANNQSKIMDALDDMKLKQINEPKIKPAVIKSAPLKKEVKRETSAMSKRGKMVERRSRKKKRGDATITNQGFTYRLRQYSVNGEEHYLIVKKRIPSNEEVEDIFEEWNHNLTIKKPKRIPRVRKLSHRAQRKEYLKENSYPMPKIGPITYADALKKNLKYRPNYIPAEDVFEVWRDTLDDLVTSPVETVAGMRRAQQEQVLLESTERAMEIGGSVIECGQPTVRTMQQGPENMRAVKSTTTVMVSYGLANDVTGRGRKRKGLQPEHFFAGWRHNLNDEEFYPKRLPKTGKKYAVEEYFRMWRRNFYVKEVYPPKQAKQLRMMPENIFGDWLHNFHTSHHKAGYPKYHTKQAHGGEPLSKKSRTSNQRRSKNKKAKNGF